MHCTGYHSEVYNSVLVFFPPITVTLEFSTNTDPQPSFPRPTGSGDVPRRLAACGWHSFRTCPASHGSGGSRILEPTSHNLDAGWHRGTLAGKTGGLETRLSEISFYSEESELGRMVTCAGGKPGKLRPGEKRCWGKVVPSEGRTRVRRSETSRFVTSVVGNGQSCEVSCWLGGFVIFLLQFLFLPPPQTAKKPQSLLLNNCSVLTGEQRSSINSAV